MTLEEAIANAEAQAIRDEKEAERKREYGGEFYDSEVKACLICAEQHRQLAEWLRELQERRSAEISPSKTNAFCSSCRNKAPEGKIYLDCLMCMHLYGVHTQEANREAAYEFINFPKRDLFELKKGRTDSERRTDEHRNNG